MAILIIRKGEIRMAVYKESDTNTWRIIYRYTDWMGARKQTSKRGVPNQTGCTGLGAGAASKDQG